MSDSSPSDGPHALYEDAQRLATATGGHVVTRHYMEGVDYIVVPGPDPRAWPEPEKKKGAK